MDQSGVLKAWVVYGDLDCGRDGYVTRVPQNAPHVLDVHVPKRTMAFAMSAMPASICASTRPTRGTSTRRASALPKRLGATAALGGASLRVASLRGVRVASTRGVSMTVKAEAGDVAVPLRVSTDAVMIDPVVGAKRFSNYFWAGVVTTGATGFLITGASSYVGHNLLWFLDATDIKFFPQGLVMSFYGVAGTLLATYLWLTINWDVGAGYNEFNKG
jgi:hypothetical protein